MSKDDIKLIRHSLGSISLENIEQKEMSEAARKEYCASISAVFPIIEKDIKKAMYEQVLLIAESDNWEKVNYGRGTCNGISLLYELWKLANTEHLSAGKEKFDPTNPIGEI